MASPTIERSLVRTLVTLSLCAALFACARVPIPRDAKGKPSLPAVAFEQVGLYRLEVALLVFYGGLLLITPAFRGLTRGRLPTEISARGAKFAAETDQSAESIRATIEELELTTTHLADGLLRANLEIEQLKQDQVTAGSQE
jgi:hypothetical protein